MAAIDYVYMYVVQAIAGVSQFLILTPQTIFVLSHMVAAFER